MNQQSLFSDSQNQLISKLQSLGQGHLFADWDEPGTNDNAKVAFIKTLSHIDQSYPGGLSAYISNARSLLAAAKEGKNPFEGMQPEQPDCVDLTKFDSTYDHYESVAAKNFDKIGFVLVAGGLGERLGYSGIKLNIPIETLQNTTYLEHYASAIRAIESRVGNNHRVPFVIMTSQDTHAKTVEALEAGEYFGLQKSQVHILRQELVPAITDNDGSLALKEKYQLQLKPHGHGDIHMLLHTSGVAKKLQAAGCTHLAFIQDTNGQVFNALPAAFGVSIEKGYDFNSIAVNRIPGEAVGALAKLVKGNESLTLNVEYNQLDPLLRATVSPEGDVPNEQGFSIFPGNINVLIIRLESYTRILEESNGIIAEFVNPKYADESRTTFKKPTRLETMMQDLPKLFGSKEKVGVTIFDRVWCFSAVKNNVTDAAAKHTAGGPPEAAATGESDFYLTGRMKLEAADCRIETAPEKEILGIPHTPGPKVVLRPSFALTLAEVRSKISNCILKNEATLILDGEDIALQNVSITGTSALVIEASQDANVKVTDTEISNPGFQMELLTKTQLEDESTPEYLRIRGYRYVDKGTSKHNFTEAGNHTVER